MTERKPRAPDLRFNASLAIATRAPSVNLSLTSSNSNNRSYCLVRAFFGSLRIRTRSSSSSSSKVAMTGSRPTSSGISPKRSRSSGCTRARISPIFFVLLPTTLAPNPIDLVPDRFLITESSPTKAPPQIKRMSVVSILIYSCWGCFLPPFGGTLATVPSIILSRACCTPSPETSLVMEALSDFLAILSISSI